MAHMPELAKQQIRTITCTQGLDRPGVVGAFVTSRPE
jgi:hypothetical protein